MLSKAMSALEADLRPTKETVARLSTEVQDKQDHTSATRIHDMLGKSMRRLNRITAELAGKAEPAMGRRTASTRCLSCNRELRQPQLVPLLEGEPEVDPRNKKALRRPQSAHALR